MTNNRDFIGKYRLIEELASGAFGRVYRGVDTSQGDQVVAVKVLHAAPLGSTQERNDFLQEAQFLKILQHPYILPVLDVGFEKDLPYLVTEYAPNGSLYDRLNKQSPRLLKGQETLNILAQVGQALQYAHRQNIIHRDLKPANILFNANGEAVLADFGIAIMLASSMKHGTAIGTPLYMAPEQFRGTISKECDQYALGCIAYELFTGRVPFTASDFFTLGYKHMTEVPIPPTQLNLLVSRTNEQAILKAMAKQRTDRYANIHAFLAALGISPTAAVYTSPTLAVPPTSFASIHAVGTSQDMIPQDEEEIATIIRSRFPEETLSVYEPVARVAPPPLISSPAPEKSAEGTGKMPIVGKTNLSLNTLSGVPETQDREEIGTVFSPASSLVREFEVAQNDIYLPPNSMQRQSHSFEEDMLTPINIGEGFHQATTIQDSPNPLTGIGGKGHLGWAGGKRRIWLIAATISLVLLLISGGVLYAMTSIYQPPIHRTATPVVTIPTATVTIIPAQKNLSSTYTISAVTVKPVASKQQVGARLLSFSTPRQSKTVQATGTGNIPATRAYGQVTFNSFLHIPETFPAGYPMPASNGVTAVVSQTFTINAWGGPFPVNAYILTPGARGNIPINSINYSCCYNYDGRGGQIDIYNEKPFSGGKDATNYTFVQGSDINNAAKQMQRTLTSNAQAAVLGQVQPNEKPIAPVQCSPKVTSDHKLGEHVTEVTTSVTVTCTEEVYDQQAALTLARNLLIQKAVADAPSGSYALGKLTTSIIRANVVDSKGTIVLLVMATASSTFQFSIAQRQELASLIAGKSELDAQIILMNQIGISQAIIRVYGNTGYKLPGNVAQITINVI